MRLAQSFDMAAPEIDPGEPVVSETAKDALALAEENQRRIKVIEDALRVVFSEDAYLDCLNGPAQKLLHRVLSELPSKAA